MAKRFKELRDKMSPQAREAAERKTKRMALALGITEKLFGEAPPHLKRPQVDELAKLGLKQLVLIARITGFPLEPALREKIVTVLKGENIIKRMERRSRFAKVISDAERDGLYEAAEHATGEVLRDLFEDTALQSRYVEIVFEHYPIEVKKKGKLWIAGCPGLDIYSQGATKDKARENLDEAIRLFIELCSSRGTLAEAIGNTDPINLCVSCHLAEKLKDPKFKKAYEREKAIIGKQVQASKGVKSPTDPIQLTAEGAKALFDLIENPPKQSPALKKAMAEVNGRRLKEEDKCRFYELAGRLSMSTDAEERRKIKKQLAQMTFGDNNHIGSNFDDFLKEEDTLKESETVAIRRVEEPKRSKRKMKGNK